MTRPAATPRALGLSIFTEADTKEELTANIREVVELYFDKPEEMHHAR